MVPALLLADDAVWDIGEILLVQIGQYSLGLKGALDGVTWCVDEVFGKSRDEV